MHTVPTVYHTQQLALVQAAEACVDGAVHNLHQGTNPVLYQGTNPIYPLVDMSIG